MAEAWAIRDGLQVAFSSNCNYLIIEADFKIIVDLINSNDNSSHYLASLICDCRALLKRFHRVEIKHNYRESYRIADLLAKEGCSQLEDFLLCPNPPLVQNLLPDDV
ncbi:hypothetical protein ACH5RR_039437 [Cinchona calisaya]|uniref:RNase H type-1 domain-containing protein n=1 Tax=Cinchona calisaya TaxID=153742 RepID=A0ABD2Y3M3_9GENT